MSDEQQIETFLNSFFEGDGWVKGYPDKIEAHYHALLFDKWSHEDIQELITDIIVATMSEYQ